MTPLQTPMPLAAAGATIAGQPTRGMIPEEARLFNAWFASNFQNYDTVAYNLRVGIGTDPGPTVGDDLRRMAIMNSQRRIDAVLTSGDLHTLVEVKVRGSLWGIGQLLGYRELYILGRPAVLSTQLLMLCGSIDVDTQYCCRRLGVNFVVVDLQQAGV